MPDTIIIERPVVDLPRVILDWPDEPIDDERAQFLHDLYRDEECDR